MILTDNQQSGIDMMVKVLNKKYPYIVDASPNFTDFEEYSTLLTFKLVMSKSKLEEYFKQKIKYYGEFWRFSNLFGYDPRYDPDDLIIDEIKQMGKMFYDSMGCEYHFQSGLRVNEVRNIKINSFFVLDDKN
jgi:hypothetical protein